MNNLTIEEIKTVYKLLEFQWISYEDLKAIEVVRKIRKIIDEHELATNPDKTT
jgi:hypothetical protein